MTEHMYCTPFTVALGDSERLSAMSTLTSQPIRRGPVVEKIAAAIEAIRELEHITETEFMHAEEGSQDYAILQTMGYQSREFNMTLASFRRQLISGINPNA